MHFGIDLSTQPDRTARFLAVKQHGRMWIILDGTLEHVYSPPDFIRLPDRAAMIELAFKLTREGCRDIETIMQFEAAWHPNKKHRN